jgi:phthalate 4,5-cis-dihydrodiol dehydrogenase
MSKAAERKLRLGVAGLGRAFTLMLPTFTGDPRVALVAAADTRAEARQRFAADFAAKSHATVEELCADPAVEAVYVATPHQHHAHHAVLAAQHGKHLLIEKPMALSLADCSAIMAAAERAGVALVVGHGHSFDAPVARLRALVEGGAFGPVRMINAINYTDFLYRPRRPEELDTAQGGGAVFNQAAHQVDIVADRRRPRRERARGDRRLRCGATDRRRLCGPAHIRGRRLRVAHLWGLWPFRRGRVAGLDRRDGADQNPYPGPSRPRFASPQEEAAFKNARNYGGADYRPLRAQAPAHQHFGTLLASCARADLRALPNGVMIYQNGSARLDPVPPPVVPRAEVIDELYAAVVHGVKPRHGGAWGLATLEVVLAILRSAREGRDVTLAHQLGLP